ncbi:hypothetical protein FSP39_017469 [Pinctada imbricata]|uniref:Major facilitator superfamily (MFS) profile domain-containing protein n=1 Tax=Pinctada imbricata TaxID=66713 RepID=A0AA89C5N2_PINIB|nr:hypothetical protein FSP39_017469 [Pinctada imbricata]
MIGVTVLSKVMTRGEEDGYRWVVVIAAFFTQFIVCGITYSVGVFQIVFRTNFNHDDFDTSWIGSILLYTTALTSIVLRVFMAKFGCRISVMTGGVVAAIGMGLGMFVTELFHLYLTFGVLVGIGFGLACTPSIMAVEQYFHKQRIQALGVVLGGVGLGIVTFPILIKHLLSMFSWRGTMWILSAVCLNLCVCGALMTPKDKRKEIHLLPLLSCLPLKNIIFHGMCIANLFWSFGSTVIYMYIPAYAIDSGSDFETTTFLISCVGLSSFVSRMIFAFMGHNSTLDDMTSLLCSVGLGVVVTGICPMLFEDYAGQVGYCILFGFYTGYWTTFLGQATRELLGPECIALGNGYLSFMIALGSIMGGPSAGLLVKEEGEFKYAFYLAGSALLWSSIIMLLFKYQSCGLDSLVNNNLNEQKQPLVNGYGEEHKDSKSLLGGEPILV